MSAIFGILPLQQQPLQSPAFEAMRNAMDHWNADRRDVHIEASFAFGQLMLFTTPESLNEKLPLRDDNRQLVITADARIDNRGELFGKLEIDRHRRAMPDSELILEAYSKYKDECVHHLIGDFAFAIWDANSQRLFCARDHMGIRPFFYYHHNNLFLFASEKKGILAVPGADMSIDKQFFVNQLYHTVKQEIDSTLYEHIRRLPPGHTLNVHARNGNIELKKYWELDADTELNAAGDGYFYEGLRHHFEEAVRCRTRSAFTVGVELSGGLDSSAITGEMVKQEKSGGPSFETFSNTLRPGITDPRMLYKDEQKYFQEVIDFHKLEKTNLVTENPFSENQQEIDFFLEANDGMEGWNSVFMIALKKKAAERNIRTLISGFGGDQLVSSSHRFRRMALLDEKKYFAYFRSKGSLVSKLPAMLPYRLQEWLFDTFHWFLDKDTRDFKETARIYNHNIPKRYQQAHRKLWHNDPSFRERYKDYRHLEKWQIHNPMVSLRAESENRYGYYFGHNSCYPLLDVRLMQFYLSSPQHIRVQEGLNRPYFRKAVFDLLPPAIQSRVDKKGGIAPFFYDRKQPYLDETTNTAERMPENPLVNRQELISRVNQIKATREEWRRKHVPGSLPKHDVILTPVESLRWIEKNPDFAKKFIADK